MNDEDVKLRTDRTIIGNNCMQIIIIIALTIRVIILITIMIIIIIRLKFKP